MKKHDVKPKLVLESLMGDPVLSYWMGPEGIAAGTALGRISAYTFSSNTNFKADKANLDNNKSEYYKRNRVIQEVNYIEFGSHSPDIESNRVGLSDKNPNYCKNSDNGHPTSSNNVDGVYSVFATYSDEPVYSVFIHNNALVCLIGTSYLMIYDVLNYKVLNQCPLHLTGSTIKGYKQILQDDKFVLICSVKGIVLINSINNEIHLMNNKLIFNDNILSFQYPFMSSSTFSLENKHEKIISVFKISLKKENLYNPESHFINTKSNADHDESLERVNEIIIEDKKVYLITLCKLWKDYVLVVCDLLTISLYNKQDNSLYKRKTVKHDILSVNSDFDDYFISLNKNSTLNLVNSNLDILHTFNLYPSTFELGWSYNVVSYKNMISYNSDEGIYYINLPDTITHVM